MALRLAEQELLPATRDVFGAVRDQINAPETQNFFSALLDFLRDGFGQVNVAEGLIIALIAALLMPSWRRWLPTAFLATVATMALHIVIPALSDQAQFHLPAMMEPAFWRFAVSLFVGYFIVIGIFFAVKRAFMRPQPQAAHG